MCYAYRLWYIRAILTQYVDITWQSNSNALVNLSCWIARYWMLQGGPSVRITWCYMTDCTSHCQRWHQFLSLLGIHQEVRTVFWSKFKIIPCVFCLQHSVAIILFGLYIDSYSLHVIDGTLYPDHSDFISSSDSVFLLFILSVFLLLECIPSCSYSIS